MAAERGEKSNAIRDYLAKHPEAGPTAVMKALAEKGVTVTPALVSNLKGKAGKGGNKGNGKKATKATKKVGRKASASSSDGYNSTTNQLVEFAGVVKQFGGSDRVRNLIDELERVTTELSS